MNKKIILSIFIVLLLIAGTGLYFWNNQEKENELAVKNLVEGFGAFLKNVPLLAFNKNTKDNQC